MFIPVRLNSSHFCFFNLVVTLADVKIDPLRSAENWSFEFGETTNSGTNLYFALNRILLFKGIAEMHNLGSSGDNLSTENNSTACSRELNGTENMVCLECPSNMHMILPERIACLPSNYKGFFFGPAKGGNLHPNLRIFCPEGHAYLPLVDGGDCMPCTNPNCSRCSREDLSKCLGCKTETNLRLDLNGSCVMDACDAN